MDDIEMIFDALSKASYFVHLNDDRSKKIRQLHDVQSLRCGNCVQWMKSGCKQEKVYKKFKTCNDSACSEFELSDIGGLIPKFKKELKEIEDKIEELVKGKK